MADMIVHYKNNKFRLWNTTVDKWSSNILSKEEMITLLILRRIEITRKNAMDRIERKGYTQSHIKWLQECWDSRRASLTRMANKEGWGEVHPMFI